MSDRIYNFSAGPAILPEPVLKQAQTDIWNIADSGVGVLEHSHRGSVFQAVADEAEAVCREIAGIPDNYKVLFLTGGASSQFFTIPMNFLAPDDTADYIVTGSWSKKAVKEAKLFGTPHVAATSEESNFTYIPGAEQTQWSDAPKYAHYTSNNTIFGTQWRGIPAVPAGVPLMCDMSSDIFSKPLDVSGYALIYAGAQKNIGPAGATLVIIREDLIEAGRADLPTMLQYRTHADKGSMYNTPPAFCMYIMGQVFKWIQDLGGLAAMQQINEDKGGILYDYLDNSDFFRPTAEPDSRSLMNVTFRGPSEDLEAKFIKEALAAGFSGLKGHRSVGGMRASIYNAFPKQGCVDLVEFMKKFETNNR
ncbi:MAG: 3-phosphoserine/phosphohydroxythreonine transaminase [Planctomycetes bacterium]|nr:3-phosphoserine/phosphohydroxythreonine transaminase [Planctomycetota bacterium]NOG54666.1 3-phosphoserine/phosphohydroxythreonine transaminase [Planctomycetota bacterium]